MTRRRDFLFWLLAGLTVPALPAFADDDGSEDGGSDHGGGGDDSHDDDHEHDDEDDKGFGGVAGKARDAVQRGEAVKLKKVLRVVKDKYPGDVIHVDLKSTPKGLVYVIRLLDQSNRRLEVAVNAVNATILSAGFY